MEEKPKLILWRISLVLAILLIAVFGALWLRTAGPSASPFGCVFNHLTGLHCPGCGMTRASHALLNGKILDALNFNFLGVIMFPIACIGLAIEARYWVYGQIPKKRLHPGAKGSALIAVTFIAFFILRNLPWFPFTILAP